MWRRALRAEDVFRYVEAACDMYPVFVWQQGEPSMGEESEEERIELYQMVQEGLRPLGLDLPD